MVLDLQDTGETECHFSCWYHLRDVFPELHAFRDYGFGDIDSISLSPGNDLARSDTTRDLATIYNGHPENKKYMGIISGLKPTQGETKPAKIYDTWKKWVMEQLTPDEKELLTTDGQQKFLAGMPHYQAPKPDPIAGITAKLCLIQLMSLWMLLKEVPQKNEGDKK